MRREIQIVTIFQQWQWQWQWNRPFSMIVWEGPKQLNGSSSVWVLSCSFKSLPSANFLSHFVQLNGLPTWLLLCCFNSSNSENLLSHCRHLKGSAPWVLSCSFKSWGSGNFLTHFEQLYGCSAGLCHFALVKEEMVAVVLWRMSHNLWCSNAKHGLRNA